MRRAYVTALAGSDDYVPGVEALGNSLAATGTSVPKIVLVTPNVTHAARERVAARGWEVRQIEPIENPVGGRQLLFTRFANVFTKLRAWELPDVERAVFLDADTIVLRNIDDLFERRRFAAAPDFFLPDRFNSGVMLLEPSAATFGEMVDRLSAEPSYDGGDQGFLNRFFSGWYAMPVEHRLPAGYNLHHFVFQFLCAHESLREAVKAEVRVVHYTLQKPWLAPTLSGGSSLWWNTYFQSHPERDAAWRRRLHQLEDWSFDSIVAALGGS